MPVRAVETDRLGAKNGAVPGFVAVLTSVVTVAASEVLP